MKNSIAALSPFVILVIPFVLLMLLSMQSRADAEGNESQRANVTTQIQPLPTFIEFMVREK